MECSRCGAPAETKTRGERFCPNCYHTFISKKFRAEMSVFRVNGRGLPETDLPLLLVFVSMGTSSLALVDLLLDMQQAQRQKNNGMMGFRFSCFHISSPDTSDELDWPWKEVSLARIKQPILANMPQKGSNKQDIMAVLRRDLVRSLAKKENGVAVLGYSMTKLSELTLSETVKGRGAAIPRLVSPDVLEDRAIYPLKDITLPELMEYVRLRDLSRYALPEPAVPGIIRNQSIDEITRSYFSDVQKEFPSVVSTVAKVASRLSQPAEICGLCQQDDTTELCYACRSSLGTKRLESKVDILKEYEL